MDKPNRFDVDSKKDVPGITGGFPIKDKMIALLPFPPGEELPKLRNAKRAIENYDILPLDFWLKNLNDESAPMSFRHVCAKAAAPYVHRRLPISIENHSTSSQALVSPEALKLLSAQELEFFQSIMVRIARNAIGTDVDTTD